MYIYIYIYIIYIYIYNIYIYIYIYICAKPFKNAMLHNFFKLIDIEKVTLVKVLNFAHNTMSAKLSRL